MKKLLTVFTVLSFFSLSAQQITFEQFKSGMPRPKPTTFNEYIASNGESFKIGDEVKINEPSGNSNLFQHIRTRIALEEELASTQANGKTGEIIKFNVYGTKKSGWELILVLATGEAVRYGVDLEQALNFKEIISKVMTREDAIAKLKEAKELLDLDMMSQEDYDKLKAELSPIIMGSN